MKKLKKTCKKLKMKKNYDGDFKSSIIISNNDHSGLETVSQLLGIVSKGNIAESPHSEIDKNSKIGRFRNHLVHAGSGGSLQLIKDILRVRLTEEAENGHRESLKYAQGFEPRAGFKVLLDGIATNFTNKRFHGDYNGDIEGDQHTGGTNITNSRDFFIQGEREDGNDHDHRGPESIADVSVQ